METREVVVPMVFDALEVEEIRRDFPILDQSVFGRPLVYLDNAATMQMPKPVLGRIVDHYNSDNANVHRGIHALSERSTATLEAARNTVAHFIGAPSPDGVVFTSGTTASLNLLAFGLCPSFPEGSAVVVTALEHHANFVPWQQACKRAGLEFVVAPIDDRGNVDEAALQHIFEAHRVSLLAFAQVSNVLGTVTPVRALCDMAHSYGALAVVDAAQSIRHERVAVRAMDCDFLAFSGHKMGAPTGIGVLWGKKEALEKVSPILFGGEMVDKVSKESTTFERLPLRLEPGTPNYVGAIGLASACDYLEGLDRERICAYEHDLVNHVERALSAIEGVHVLGSPCHRAGCVSFVVDGAHPYDIATLVDKMGVAVRSGNQCAQPLLHETYGVQNVARISPAFYNTHEEVDYAVGCLERVLRMLKR